MITLHTFASGSEGNCLLISAEGTYILVDAGISCRRICTCLQELALDITQLSAILITHSHSDHIGGLATLCKKCSAPVYTSAATAAVLRNTPHIAPLLRQVESGEVFSVGAVRITAFPTSHDAPGSMDFRMDCGGSVGILTDTGYVTDEAEDTLRGVDLLVLESNHDVARLKAGPYPYPLQQRILGDCGHLSNETAALFARRMAMAGTRQIILAHLSRENNTPELAMSAVEAALYDCDASVTLAPRSGVSCTYTVQEALCRK